MLTMILADQMDQTDLSEPRWARVVRRLLWRHQSRRKNNRQRHRWRYTPWMRALAFLAQLWGPYHVLNHFSHLNKYEITRHPLLLLGILASSTCGSALGGRFSETATSQTAFSHFRLLPHGVCGRVFEFVAS